MICEDRRGGCKEKKKKEENNYRATLGVVGDAAGVEEKVADGFEDAIAVEAEVEIFVGENVDEVVDDGLVDVSKPRPQHLVHRGVGDLSHISPSLLSLRLSGCCGSRLYPGSTRL